MQPNKFESIPMDVYNQLDMKLRSLEQALLEKDPLMPNHLRESHRLLQTYPETVHLLDDEEIRTLIQAVEKHVQVKVVSETAAKKGSGSRKKISAEDL